MLLIHRFLCVLVVASVAVFSLGAQPETAVLSGRYSSVAYKGSIDVFGKHLSGIFFVKKMDADRYRLVLMSEFGLNLMDFEMEKDSVRLVSCQDFLNKPALTTVIGNDFKTLLRPLVAAPDFKQKIKSENYIRITNGDRKYKLWTDGKDQRLQRMSIKGGWMSGVLYRFGYDGQQLPLQIDVAHKGMPLRMSLVRFKIVD